jgi:hypothetical protein
MTSWKPYVRVDEEDDVSGGSFKSECFSDLGFSQSSIVDDMDVECGPEPVYDVDCAIARSAFSDYYLYPRAWIVLAGNRGECSPNLAFLVEDGHDDADPRDSVHSEFQFLRGECDVLLYR